MSEFQLRSRKNRKEGKNTLTCFQLHKYRERELGRNEHEMVGVQFRDSELLLLAKLKITVLVFKKNKQSNKNNKRGC